MSKNNNYIVLARKYRPKNLKDVIGQEDICSVIEGSIKLNRVAHAFLFSGTRGVGKTTLARILAKILNCEKLEVENIEACHKCANCISIENESNMDVIEIDAASRTGVADVREIIENINYKPVSSKKKIFIIDEVHMLSKAAFNALLKTLEEPPSDVTFIFATTETEKIPVTVLSRCQHFSLQRVSLELIAKHLIQVSKLEGYELDFEASKLIAQCSEGSMRDALSILENVFAKGEKINISIVREVLGISDLSAVIMLFENLCKGDVNLSFDCFEKLYSQGVSIDQLAKSLMSLAYNLSLVKSGIKNTSEFFDEQSSKKLEDISKNFEMDFIIRFWELMQKYVNELTDVFNEKQCFEMIIMRLCYASLLPTPFEVIKKKSDIQSLKKNGEILEDNKLDQSKNMNLNSSVDGVINDNLARKKNIPKESTENNKEVELKKFAEIVSLIEKQSEMLVAYHLKNSFRLVSFSEPKSQTSVGNIELQSINDNHESKKILWSASKTLEFITKKRWILTISNKIGLKSLQEVEDEKKNKNIEKLKNEKLIKKILEIIPSSEVISVKPIKKNIQEE
jgi:DNA polymerase-3 subunit gamma/tau